MKSLWIRFVCLTLALTVLSGSVGLAATRHICLLTGMVMPAEDGTKGDSCCKKKKEKPARQASFEKKCCELSVTHARIQAETNSTTYALKLPALHLWADKMVRFTFWQLGRVTSGLTSYAHNKAPPLAGRALLTFIQILRI